MKKYYKVEAAMGHVGKGYYTPKFLYIEAINREEAAAIARTKPRVKRDYSNCIFSVCEVSHDEYIEGLEKNSKDIFMTAKSIQEYRNNGGNDEVFALEGYDIYEKKYKSKWEKKKIPNLKKYKTNYLGFDDYEYDYDIA